MRRVNPVPSATAGLQLGTLQNLAHELGDPQAALRFLAKYLTLLPHRIERITHGLERRDAASTTDALLSLKITSAMVGATALEAQCAYLSTLHDAELLHQGPEHLPALQQAAAELQHDGADLQLDAATAMTPGDRGSSDS